MRIGRTLRCAALLALLVGSAGCVHQEPPRAALAEPAVSETGSIEPAALPDAPRKDDRWRLRFTRM
jgi:hypothetical protein